MIELTAAHLKIPAAMARKYGRRGPWLEDLEGAGLIALVRAARAYLPIPGGRPDGFLILCVKRAVFSAMRIARLQKAHRARTVRLASQPPPADYRRTGRDDSEATEEVARLLDLLVPRSREAVLSFVVEGKRIEDIARSLGVSLQRVGQIKKKALALMREAAL